MNWIPQSVVFNGNKCLVVYNIRIPLVEYIDPSVRLWVCFAPLKCLRNGTQTFFIPKIAERIYTELDHCLVDLILKAAQTTVWLPYKP